MVKSSPREMRVQTCQETVGIPIHLETRRKRLEDSLRKSAKKRKQLINIILGVEEAGSLEGA